MEAIVFIILLVVLVVWLSPGTKRVKKSNQNSNTSDFELTDEFKEILEILNNTRDSIFITGKAGTGKSSLLRHFVSKTKKKHIILAPTGIAALNVSGQTIHSFFRFPPALINVDQITPDYLRAELFKNIDMIIIDEVSMVRADLMDGIDVALRKNRNRLNEPFGGVQMVFIGDLFQLPPVVTSSDRSRIQNAYASEYFFDANVFKIFRYHFKELTKIFRQSESQTRFKELLNNIRVNAATFEDMSLLNSRHIHNAGPADDAVFLTSRRAIAKSINNEKLSKLVNQEFEFTGTLSGKYSKIIDQPEERWDDVLPAPLKLKLKKGAQIMMLKNDPGKRWANGTVGKVCKITKDELWVSIDAREFNVEKETWKEVDFVLNKETKEIEARTTGSFTQYPVQLSFAMTIHKSQGKTFDKIVIDIGTGAFAHGQVYVALSRCTTLEGITLNNAINDRDIIVDPRVVEFYKLKTAPKSQPRQQSNNDIKELLIKAMISQKPIVITYQNFDGEVSKRTLSRVVVNNKYIDKGYYQEHIKAYCHLRKEEREFKIDRIRHIEIVG